MTGADIARRHFQIPLRLRETQGISRQAEPLRTGVPLPKGLLDSPQPLQLVSSDGNQKIPCQSKVLARWGDGSIKWLLVDGVADVDAGAELELLLEPDMRQASGTAQPQPTLRVERSASETIVDTGAARFHLPLAGSSLVSNVTVAGAELLSAPGVIARLTMPAGDICIAHVQQQEIEAEGQLAASVVVRGDLRSPRHRPALCFYARLRFTAGSALLRVDFTIWNPRPASHPGGLWDLGDSGSILLRDLTVSCAPGFPVRELRWVESDVQPVQSAALQSWALYQDSSGGERWRSPNHLDRHGMPTVAFRGYRIERSDRSGSAAPVGDRATPAAQLVGEGTAITVAADRFWQQFPKALRWDSTNLQVGLFPGESTGTHELQGGERKTHAVFLHFGPDAGLERVRAALHPVLISVDPAWIEQSRAIPWFAARTDQDDQRYARYLDSVISGGHSQFAKRELIDEYGWRNFGDLYADHEAVNHQGAEPFVSHYNNQYDFIYGAFLQFLRSGDHRWHELMIDAARHCVDIDIYHTRGDKSAFNGGLFWHTDHYKPAATSTHRTYSRYNGSGGGYGGGPGNEHNYTSGLLHHYFLTGDQDARDAVIELADWVLAMDDGTLTLLGVVDAGPTGAASATVSPDYHKAGRGAGNSINALLDAYAATSRRHYMSKAEELIQRCIHPRDDIAALGLDEPEYRWSYLVFLQVLAKYLEHKIALTEYDYAFYHARDSLLHYAAWILHHESPYKDMLHKVEIPTETWPAHDIRKAHVLYAAARYASAADRMVWRERAGYYVDRCIDDVLGFGTAYLTRPQVILSVHGSLHEYFRQPGSGAADAMACRRHAHEFGLPVVFIPQRARFKRALRDKCRVLVTETRRLLRSRLAGLVNRNR